MKIDVGCGSFPSGDVNCDLFLVDIGHRTGSTTILGQPLKPQKIENFVLCDVQHLPFRDNTFDEAYSSHVIEHVKNPFLLLKEMIRVSRCKIVIFCPHRLGDRLQGKNPFHINFLNKSWFYTAVRPLNCRGVKIDYSRYLNLPTDFFCLFRMPIEMRVEIRK